MIQWEGQNFEARQEGNEVVKKLVIQSNPLVIHISCILPCMAWLDQCTVVP